MNDEPTAPVILESTEGSGQYRVSITSAFRTSGLLMALPATELRNLLLLLTFTSTDGRVRATLPDIAQAMACSEDKAKRRLGRLIAFSWDGRPIVQELRWRGNEFLYAVSDHVFGNTSPTTPEAETSDSGDLGSISQSSQQTTGPTSTKDLIISQSREKYSRSRESVENRINAMYRVKKPNTSESVAQQICDRLLELGVPRRLAEEVLERYPAGDVIQQLEWLPYRKAKNPARLIVAAIEHHYEEPFGMRKQKREVELRREGEASESSKRRH